MLFELVQRRVVVVNPEEIFHLSVYGGLNMMAVDRGVVVGRDNMGMGSTLRAGVMEAKQDESQGENWSTGMFDFYSPPRWVLEIRGESPDLSQNYGSKVRQGNLRSCHHGWILPGSHLDQRPAGGAFQSCYSFRGVQLILEMQEILVAHFCLTPEPRNQQSESYH